jgi:hypothetical protein
VAMGDDPWRRASLPVLRCTWRQGVSDCSQQPQDNVAIVTAATKLWPRLSKRVATAWKSFSELMARSTTLHPLAGYRLEAWRRSCRSAFT